MLRKNDSLLVVLAAIVWASLPRVASAQIQQVALTHVTVIAANGTPPQPDMTLLVTGNRITEVGRSGRVSVPRNARVVDAAGKFLIPGLWDMHAHIYPRADSVGFPHFAFLVANGVTGVRAMMSPLKYLDSLPQIRKEIEEGKTIGPRIVSTGPILDGPRGTSGPGETVVVANEQQARDGVRMVKAHGAAFVKFRDNLSRETFLALADESKKQGLTFSGHTPTAVGAAEASDAGVRSIEHLTDVFLSSSSEEDVIRAQMIGRDRQAAASNQATDQTARILATFSREKADRLLARFRQNGTWQCPTLSWMYQAVAFIDKTAFSPERLGPISPQLQAQWDTRRPNWTRFFGTDLLAAQQTMHKSLGLVGMMNRAGVPLLAGTDSLKPFFSSGYTLHEELRLMVDAGLTPMEALQTATINPARFLRLDKELGTVEKGKLADLVLLDGSPLEDIRNTQKIRGVVLGGRYLDRAALDELARAAQVARQ